MTRPLNGGPYIMVALMVALIVNLIDPLKGSLILII